ncbi:MAG: hypothetical protein WBB23_22715 [Desulforhopalus sp.]
MNAPWRWRQPFVAFSPVSIKVLLNPTTVVGRQIGSFDRYALIGVDPIVEQLEQDDRQGEPVLVFSQILRMQPTLQGFGRDIAVGILVCGKTPTIRSLDAQPVAIQQRQIKSIQVDAEIDGLHVDNVMSASMQCGDQCRQVGRSNHPVSVELGQPQHLAGLPGKQVDQLGGTFEIDKGHDIAGKSAPIILHYPQGPGDLNIGCAIFPNRDQIGRHGQHGLDLFLPFGILARLMVDFCHQFRPMVDAVDFSISAAGQRSGGDAQLGSFLLSGFYQVQRNALQNRFMMMSKVLSSPVMA